MYQHLFVHKSQIVTVKYFKQQTSHIVKNIIKKWVIKILKKLITLKMHVTKIISLIKKKNFIDS